MNENPELPYPNDSPADPLTDPPAGRCPGCGAEVDRGACDGLCPVCLLSGAMAATGGGAAVAEPSLEAVRAAFPQLEVIERIGSGGMGTVFKARQLRLDRPVALKVIPASRPGDEAGFGARFDREGRLLARLHHPNIVTVYDSGRAGDFYFLLMEYVEGVTLREAMRASRFSPAQALALVPKICEALQYAHDEGILHRDIKPENILLDTRGRVKLADFGIAKLMAAPPEVAAPDAPEAAASPPPDGLTRAGATLGTPQYMAPEQAEQPAGVDHRADIYSLGVVFYELLTGELPPAPFAPPSTRTELDRRIDDIVRQALERERDRRQHSAAELKTQVESVAANPASPAAPAPSPVGDSTSREFVSRRRLFGLPLLHVALGQDPRTGFARKARGVVAIGPHATGVLAFGGRASGVVAFGGIAVGVVAVGGIAAGVVAFGGVALAVLLALAGVAVGTLAAGGTAAGWVAHGGKALGAVAAGRDPSGAALEWPPGKMPGVLEFLAHLGRNADWILPAIAVAGLLVAMAIGSLALAAAKGRPVPPPCAAAIPTWWRRLSFLLRLGCWLLALPFWIGSAMWFYLLSQESGGWHPAGSEAAVAAGTWLGALLFPALAILFRLLGHVPGQDPPPPEPESPAPAESTTAAISAEPPHAGGTSPREFVSRRRLFGLPLLHVTLGKDPLTGKPRRAHGVVAIGPVATGVLAIGGKACGVVALGGIAAGVVAVGGISAGVVSFGAVALALLFALGAAAAGTLAVGGITAGLLPIPGTMFFRYVLPGNFPEALNYLYLPTLSYPWIFPVLAVAAVLIALVTGARAAAAEPVDPGTPRDPAAPPAWWRAASRPLGIACWLMTVPYWLKTAVWMFEKAGGSNHAFAFGTGTLLGSLVFPALGTLIRLTADASPAPPRPPAPPVSPRGRAIRIAVAVVAVAAAAGMWWQVTSPSRQTAAVRKPLPQVQPLSRNQYAKSAYERLVPGKVKRAGERLETVRKRHEAGIATAAELIEAETELAVVTAGDDTRAVARARYEGAERLLMIARARHEAGASSPAELIEAETNLEVARVYGDPLSTARARREGARKLLNLAEQRHAAGVESIQAIDDLQDRLDAIDAEIERLQK